MTAIEKLSCLLERAEKTKEDGARLDALLVPVYLVREIIALQPSSDLVSRQAVLELTTELKFDSIKGLEHYQCRHIDPMNVRQLPPARIPEKPKKRKRICWQFCRDLNDINEAIYGADPDWEGLYSAEQIINILYHPAHGSYVVFWKREMTT